MTDGPDLFEMVRMCLAEVGIDGSSVRQVDNTITYDPALDDHAVWRAAAMVGWTSKRDIRTCWLCAQAALYAGREGLTASIEQCRAFLPLTEDCGIDRGPSSTGDSGR